MAIPKSEKLLEEEAAGVDSRLTIPAGYDVDKPIIHDSQKRRIKTLYPLNKYVAIWLEPLHSTILLTDEQKYKDEGVVVGFGKNVTSVAVGDLVLFTKRPVQMLQPTDGFYANETIMIIHEDSLVLKVRSLEVEQVS